MGNSDPGNGRQVYLIGGICGIVLGVGFLIIIALYAPIGAPPDSVELLLPYLANNSGRWWWIIGLSVFTDFLFVPLAASIYFVFEKSDRFMAWLAAACIILFVFLDLTITWTNYDSAMLLAHEYSKASTALQKVELLANAEPIGAALHSKLLFVYNSLTLAVGILLSGFLVLRSNFGNVSAYLGIASGCAGVLAVAGSFFNSAMSSGIIVASCLTTLWVFVLGCQFFRRGIEYWHRDSTH